MSLLIKHFYQFREFTLDTEQRVLLRKGKPVSLTPKLFDTLLILVENSGRIIEKGEMMNRLWPDTFVEETNLTSNIQQLRKCLGDNARHPIFIETVARRGYRFIAEVEEVLSESSPGGRISERFEVPPIPPPGSEATISSSNANNLLATPAAGSVSSHAHKKSITITAGLLIVLLAGLLLLWKFSANRLSEGTAAGTSVASLPLKIEKLTGTGQSGLVAISSDGRYIAYTRDLEKKAAIWLRQLVTSTNVEIVPWTGRVYGLAFAHSGEYLYFVKGDPTGLYRVSLLGGVQTKVVDKLEGKFSISPDDRRIAFIRSSISGNGQRECALIVVNSDGSGERVLAKTQPNKLDAPAWSPDGESIVCAYGNSASGGQGVSLVEVRIADGTLGELSSERFANILKIAWLPQKSGLIISAIKNIDDNERPLWLASYPDMKFRPITTGLTYYSDLSVTADADRIVTSERSLTSDVWVGESREPQNLKNITAAIGLCFTPNRRLLYWSKASGNTDLWMMQPDGAEQKQLTANAGSNGNAAVAPDNRYIVFVSNRTGTFQVWRMNIDGSNQVQLTDGVGKNFPSISPDGRWVIYNTTDNWDLWKISMDGGEPSRITERAVFFPSVSPDGKTIACLARTESKSSLLILPIAGGAPLKTIDVAGHEFAGTRIQWSPDGNALIYAIERDDVTALVKQTLDNGRVEEIEKLEDELFDFGYSADGQLLAVTRGRWQRDVLLISDFKQMLK